MYNWPATMSVFLSGSAFMIIGQGTPISPVTQSVYEFTTLYVSKSEDIFSPTPYIENEKENQYNFGKLRYTFTPIRDGEIVPYFKFGNGIWYISDVSIKSIFYGEFTPGHTYILTEMPTIQKNDAYDFKLFYYTYDGIKSRYVSSVKDRKFQGRSYLLPNALSGSNNYVPIFKSGSIYLVNSIISQSADNFSIYVSGSLNALTSSFGYIFTTAVSSPGLSGEVPEIIDYIGNMSNGVVLAEPTTWFKINIGGVEYKIPAY